MLLNEIVRNLNVGYVYTIRRSIHLSKCPLDAFYFLNIHISRRLVTLIWVEPLRLWNSLSVFRITNSMWLYQIVTPSIKSTEELSQKILTQTSNIYKTTVCPSSYDNHFPTPPCHLGLVSVSQLFFLLYGPFFTSGRLFWWHSRMGDQLR